MHMYPIHPSINPLSIQLILWGLQGMGAGWEARTQRIPGSTYRDKKTITPICMSRQQAKLGFKPSAHLKAPGKGLVLPYCLSSIHSIIHPSRYKTSISLPLSSTEAHCWSSIHAPVNLPLPFFLQQFICSPSSSVVSMCPIIRPHPVPQPTFLCASLSAFVLTLLLFTSFSGSTGSVSGC